MRQAPKPNKPSPTGSLLVGVSLLALVSYWPALTGAQPDAGDQFYLGLFQFMGALGLLGAVVGYYKAWRLRERRKEAESASGVFGAADSKNPELQSRSFRR